MTNLFSKIDLHSSAIELRGVKKSFKPSLTKPRVEILKNLSFSVKSGSITGFLGANGAGKTTTFKCILGLIFPDEGEITFFGKSDLTAAVKSKIGFMPERPQFPEHLSGEEFLLYYLRLSQDLSVKIAKQKVNLALQLVRLTEARHKLLKTYSKGMIQRIGIAQAVIHEPELVILDEPMSGLDPDGRYEVAELITNIHKSGKTVFFSSHLLDDIQKLCDQLVIVKSGQTLFEGSKVDFLQQYQSSFRISYLQQAESKTIMAESLTDLNQKVDELRAKGFTILEVSNKNTLEQAYVSFQKSKA